jgi:hypothetical protein
MGRLEWSYQFFSKDGLKFLMLELVIVFLGVYGAFLLQNYSENQKLKSEQEKVLAGLKEDLEYFRIYFPGFTSSGQVEQWQETLNEEKYIDFSEWRFIQPQYDYTAIEYALKADAAVIDYELNSKLAEIYLELQKLRYAEDLMTGLAMKYVDVPEEYRDTPEGRFQLRNNYLNFERFVNRADDRNVIMRRIAQQSSEFLPTLNEMFSTSKLREIEISLIKRRIQVSTEKELEEVMPEIKFIFPDLPEKLIREELLD